MTETDSGGEIGQMDSGDRELDAARGSRWFLRHCVATLAYRGAKAVRGAPGGFETFRPSPATRSSGEILAHIGDLLDWALSLAEGRQRWQDSPSLEWEAGTRRFFAAMAALDAYLASGQPLHVPAEKIFQGPIADALTHVGQIATRRALAGAPVRGENYYVADIAAGRVGPEQAPPRREFD
ncbi:MAG TPA: hypothetical protein VI007_01615 [bacterium]